MLIFLGCGGFCLISTPETTMENTAIEDNEKKGKNSKAFQGK